MSLNSVNTNIGAMIALQSLNQTNTQLGAVQKQISTGYRVSDATDDGAAYAVAQRVRSDVGALTSANQQLGNVKGLLSTTVSGLNNVSNSLNSMRDVLVKLADGNTSGNQRTQYQAQYNSMLANVKTFIQDANYSGKTLIGNIGGTAGFSKVAVVRNEIGATYGIATFGGSAFYGSLSFTTTQMGGAGTMASMITAGGTFMKMVNTIGTQLNNYGAASNVRRQPDQLQQRQGRFLEQRPWIAHRCGSRQGIRTVAGFADPSAAWYPVALDRQPGAADTAQPLQVEAELPAATERRSPPERPPALHQTPPPLPRIWE